MAAIVSFVGLRLCAGQVVSKSRAVARRVSVSTRITSDASSSSTPTDEALSKMPRAPEVQHLSGVNNVLPVRQKRLTRKKEVRVQVVKTITLDVESDATLHDVKALIEYREGIPVEDQLLYYADQRLADDLPVTHYNIPRKSAILMRLRGEEIFVKTFDGSTVTLDFKPTHTVGAVKARAIKQLVRQSGKEVNVEEVFVSFAGQELGDEDAVLADYGVQPDSTLFLDRAMRISIWDNVGEEAFCLDVVASNTVRDVLDVVARERGIERGGGVVKLIDGTPNTPARGYHRILDETKTFTDLLMDENTLFVLEQLLTIRMMNAGKYVDLWSYEVIDEVYNHALELCPENLPENYRTSSEFLSKCEQSKLEVFRTRTIFNEKY